MEWLAALILLAIPSPVLSAPIPEPVALTQPTLQEQALAIAEELDFSTTTLFAVINAETGGTWDCSKVGKAGEQGCLQIIPKYHEVDPTDFNASVRYFIEQYKKGNEFYWVSCSCWAFVKTQVKDLPKMKDIVPNANRAVGTVAVFQYKKSKHIALVTEVHDTYFIVRESNFNPCELSKRKVYYDDKNLLGFYSPSALP